jgi:predicted outer membrane protein
VVKARRTAAPTRVLYALAAATLAALAPASAAAAHQGHAGPAAQTAPTAPAASGGHAAHLASGGHPAHLASGGHAAHMASGGHAAHVRRAQPAPTRGASGDGQPVGPADIDLLVKVRLAGLWEMPAGQMASTKGVAPRVREIGTMIATQHGQLDALVLAAAAKVGVPLPSQATTDQLGWLAEMERAEGAEFDQVFVDRLRSAHGKVFPVIADVRAGTRNDVVRELAQQANNFVLNHLTYLESTGLVDYPRLPLPPEPLPAARSATGGIKSGVDPIIVWFVLAAAVVTGAATIRRVVRPR